MNDKGKDVNSDWLADQWDERSVLGHAQVNKGRMKGDDPQILLGRQDMLCRRKLVCPPVRWVKAHAQ